MQSAPSNNDRSHRTRQNFIAKHLKKTSAHATSTRQISSRQKIIKCINICIQEKQTKNELP
jgi:hypothetical protein